MNLIDPAEDASLGYDEFFNPELRAATATADEEQHSGVWSSNQQRLYEEIENSLRENPSIESRLSSMQTHYKQKLEEKRARLEHEREMALTKVPRVDSRSTKIVAAKGARQGKIEDRLLEQKKAQ